jgi:hypothetical protein
MSPSARAAARTAQSSAPFRLLARGGYVANGVLHLLLGVLVLVASFGGSDEADQSGAFRAVGAAPLGFVALWVLAAGLFALGAWHAVAAFLPGGTSGVDRLGRIVTEAGKAVAYAAVGGVAASIALGARPQGEQGAENASGGLLALPGGPVVLFLLGAVVGGIGVGFVVIGVRRGFRKRISPPAGAAGTALVGLGVVGYAAKGVALAIVGVLLMIAAVRLDPETAGGLDGAVRALLQLPAGPLLGTAVGIGLIAYGAFTVLRARYARLEA